MTHLSTENSQWDVDGPDPVAWPGKAFEMLAGTPGFVEPDLVVSALSKVPSDTPWTVDKSNCSVENIYTLKKDGSPWAVRTRLAGSNAHVDADYVEYVLDFKFLLGTQETGSYRTKELARGSLAEIKAALSNLEPMLEAKFKNHCKFENEHPIIASLTALEQALVD